MSYTVYLFQSTNMRYISNVGFNAYYLLCTCCFVWGVIQDMNVWWYHELMPSLGKVFLRPPRKTSNIVLDLSYSFSFTRLAS